MSIGFQQQQYLVSEAQRTISICALLQGQTDRTISLPLILTTQSASTDDFTTNTSSLTFLANSLACVEVEVVQDGLLEDEESFAISLGIGDNNAEFVQLTNTTATVFIANSDGMLSPLL